MMSIADTNIDLRETHIIGRGTREKIVSSTLCPTLRAHQISLVGLTDADPHFRFVRPDPPWGQLLACSAGRGWVRLEDRWVSCEAGQVYVTPPHTLHAYHADAASRWSLCWVQSSGDWLSASSQPRLFSADPAPLTGAVLGLHREVMQSRDLTLQPPWSLLVSSYALRLVRPGPGDPRLRRLWEQVTADLAAPWTVDALAARLRVSPEHLRRLCQTELGVSPMRHVTALRMHQASALLASASYTVEAVACSVGYDSPYAFSTAFKRQMGVSPSAYRLGNGSEVIFSPASAE